MSLHPTPDRATVSSRLVRPFLEVLRDHGIDVSSLTLGPPESHGDTGDLRISHRQAMNLLDAALKGTGDPALGLHAAEKTRPGDFDVLEFAARSSSTLGEAMECLNRYMRLLHDAAYHRMEVGPKYSKWTYRLLTDLEAPAAVAELILAILKLAGERIVGRELAPTEVHFTHPAPLDTGEHDRVFRCPVRFDMPEHGMIFPTENLSIPLPAADPALKALLDKVARSLVTALPLADTWSERVQSVLAESLCREKPSLEAVARELRVAPRTLRRRLVAEGTNLTRLVDEVRWRLSRRYLEQQHLSVADVSLLLGFSEPSAFYRAFRRWESTSPAEYRWRWFSR